MQVFYKHICFIHTYVVSSTVAAAREWREAKVGFAGDGRRDGCWAPTPRKFPGTHTNSALIY